MRYHELVRRVQKKGEFASREQAVTAIKATLSSLGECLYRTERRHLASQLPEQAAAFLEEYVDSGVTRPATTCLTLQEFYDRVGARADVTRTDAIDRANGVTAVLQQVVPEAEWEHILKEMPKDFRGLLTGESPEPTSPAGS